MIETNIHRSGHLVYLIIKSLFLQCIPFIEGVCIWVTNIRTLSNDLRGPLLLLFTSHLLPLLTSLSLMFQSNPFHVHQYSVNPLKSYSNWYLIHITGRLLYQKNETLYVCTAPSSAHQEDFFPTVFQDPN